MHVQHRLGEQQFSECICPQYLRPNLMVLDAISYKALVLVEGMLSSAMYIQNIVQHFMLLVLQWEGTVLLQQNNACPYDILVLFNIHWQHLRKFPWLYPYWNMYQAGTPLSMYGTWWEDTCLIHLAHLQLLWHSSTDVKGVE